MGTRIEIANDLVHGCPDDSYADHAAIADALVRGDDASAILEMAELSRWPETYVWLKSELAA